MGKAMFFWAIEICTLILFAANSTNGFQGVQQSVKTTFPKDISRFRAKVMGGMQTKINSLEASVNHIDAKVKSIEVRNKGLEKSLHEQKSMLDKLEQDFYSVLELISTHRNSIDELKLTAYSDDGFKISNETCGGVLQAQSGFAIYTSKLPSQSILEFLRSTSHSYSSWLASSCVWTIQANHRSLIKFTAQVLNLPYNSRAEYPSGAYALEGMASNAEDTTVHLPRVTKLIKGVTYKFKGPLLYIVLYFPDNTRISSLNTFSFQFEYEGQGRRVRRNTFFSHKQIDVRSSKRRKFTEKDAKDTPQALDGYLNVTDTSPELSFTSIVLSNFTTALHLGTVLGKENCSNQTFMTVLPITDILLGANITRSPIMNLCEMRDDKQVVTGYAQPIMILISKPSKVELPFNLSWTAETEYPPMYISIGNESNLQQTTCGSVLGGSTGYISYKRENKYKNGERCVWVISPQPAPRSSIDITFTQDITVGSYNSREANNYDHVDIIEFTNIDGNERDTGPKVTRLSVLYTTAYKAKSREVYVVFYSDSSVTSNGFLVRWEASGETLKNTSDVTSRFNLMSSRNGTIELITRDSSFFSILNQVFVFIPNLPSDTSSTPDYVFGMDLQLNQTRGITSLGQSSRDEFTCIQEHFDMFTLADNGFLQKRNNSGCSNSGDALIKNADGLVILFVKNSAANENLNNVTLNFSWKQDGGDITKMENDKCGGVIIGNRGILRYKLEQKYNRNEHCLWLLQSPNSTSITLKIMKEGFGVGDHLIVNSIDADAGILRNDAVELRSPFHKTQTINDSLLVISFRPSSTNLNSTGFLLQFWSSSKTEDEDDAEERDSLLNNDDYIDYRLRHSELHSGRFLYEWSSQNTQNPGQQLHVIAFSTSTIASVAARPKITNVNWTYGVFKKNNESCTYDSIRFYTTLLGNGPTRSENSLGGLWQQDAVFPNENLTASCPNQVKVANSSTISTANYSSFLVIYKLVAYPLEVDSGGDERKIDFTHTQTQRQTTLEEERDEDSYSSGNPLSRSYSGYHQYLSSYLQHRHRHYGFGHLGRRWQTYGR